MITTLGDVANVGVCHCIGACFVERSRHEVISIKGQKKTREES